MVSSYPDQQLDTVTNSDSQSIMVILPDNSDEKISRIVLDLSKLESMVTDILPNSIAMRRQLTPQEDIERVAIRAMIASPLGKSIRPPAALMQLQEYKDNSLLFMVTHFVRELIHNACSTPVQAHIVSQDDGTLAITWDNEPAHRE